MFEVKCFEDKLGIQNGNFHSVQELGRLLTNGRLGVHLKNILHLKCVTFHSLQLDTRFWYHLKKEGFKVEFFKQLLPPERSSKLKGIKNLQVQLTISCLKGL